MQRSFLLWMVCGSVWFGVSSLYANDLGVHVGWGSDNGRILFEQLNCTACHADSDAAPARQGPRLGAVGQRVTPQFLRAFLENPQQLKPGTAMPDLLHGLADNKRRETVDRLVHFLVSLGGPMDQRESGSSLTQLERGKSLYHSAGCVACHPAYEPPPKHEADPATAGPEEAEGQEVEESESKRAVVRHGELAMKTTVDALADFLADPLRIRPVGRMPSMNLEAGEARLIAAYLLRDQYTEKESAPGVGLDAALYSGVTNSSVPDFEKATPVWEGTTTDFDLKKITFPDGKPLKGNFALRFQGLIDVPEDGLYRFWTKSDDGSMLYIDGQTVVSNDGPHGPTEKEGSIQLAKGRHVLELGFAQGSGGFELSVFWQPPSAKKRSAIPPGVLLHSAAAMLPHGIVEFSVDPDKAEQGRKLFASLGCAACHDTTQDTTPAVANKLTARPLAKLSADAADGCLGERVAAGRPKFGFNAAQRAGLRAALNRSATAPLTPSQMVEHTMQSYHCYGCHVRDGKGGPDDQTANYFAYEVVVDLGDEGRLPPPLNEVGAKLTETGFAGMLFQGQRYRTYMATRMPQYGKQNIGHLPAAFARADVGKIPPYKPEFSNRLIDDGRQLVGTKMLACINCHAWGDLRLPGAEGMDFVQAAQRLQPAWFHAFLSDPQKLKPRTRMPTAWPDGKSFFPDLLDGDADLQMDAIWAYLSVGRKGGTPPGLSPEDKSILVPTDDPIVFRTFLNGVSAHAILVGYRQRTHVAFDANRIKMAAAWTGDFVSTKPVWNGRAGQYAQMLGSDIVRFPEGPAFAVLESDATPWPEDLPKAKIGSSRTREGWRFLGYRYDKDRNPTFLYNLDGVEVAETPGTDFRREEAVVFRRLRLQANRSKPNLMMLVARGNEITRAGDHFVVDQKLNYKISTDNQQEPFVRESAGAHELLLPIRFNGQNVSNVEIELTW